jgi:ABC-type nitrate/sulfonate/bicarbonate transport system permease component
VIKQADWRMRRISGFSAVLILPAPTAIFAAFLETPGVFLRHLGSTLGTTCLGFGLGGGLGVALAVGIVYSRLLERTIHTLLAALNSIPFVSLLLLGLVGTVLFFVVDYAERLCLPGHVSQRARDARSARRA